MSETGHQSICNYEMHPLIQEAYKKVHDWFEEEAGFLGYKDLCYSTDAQRALKRENLKYAAFNFNLYFPTHYFKAVHALQSEQVIGLELLAAWLRYNPYLAIVDVGCGDGAASAAVIASLLELRKNGQLDSRQIKVFCSGIDPNLNALTIYKRMLDEIARAVANLGIDITFLPVPYSVSQASGKVEQLLFELRKNQWQQPSLSHAILIMSNLTDILYGEYQKGTTQLQSYAKFGLSLPEEPFGESVSAFIRQLFEGIPIDHLHLLSIDTRPQEIQTAINQMVESIQIRMHEKGHLFENSNVQLEKIQIKNPDSCYWKRSRNNSNYTIGPFLVFSGHIHNHDLAADARWKVITSQENLELAWARARQTTLREAFNDEIEIRLFEKDLEENLSRLHFELENYAIHARYIKQILQYGFPKSQGKTRPKGLTWLEEEILITAIIQVIGISVLRDKPWSYAYRLSAENSVERGATEYLYERWSTAWQQYLSDIDEYAQKFISGFIFKTDIQSYFTHILQDRLKNILKSELQISKRIEWLVELLVTKEIKDHDQGQGLVQGSIGSGFLANLYLTPLDNLYPSNDAKQRRLFRYMDDIIVVIPNSTDADSTITNIDQVFNDLELKPNPDKTGTLPVENYLATSGLDKLLDEFNNRYEDLIDQLWWMNDSLQEIFRSSTSNEQHWWRNINIYRSCLIEVGFYFSDSQISREISRKIVIDAPNKVGLDIPDLPLVTSISDALDWAKQFRMQNADWWDDIKILKNDLDSLFCSNFEFLNGTENSLPKIEIEKSGRQLRFTANRIGILGFSTIHDKLTYLLCHKPWILRYPSILLEDLGRQGYIEDIWTVVDFHNDQLQEISPYLCAIALRALRFAPRLEVDNWQKLIEYMFIGNEVTCLMASESWLMLSANMLSTPHAAETLENVSEILFDTKLPSRRLLKNYLLILGKLDPSALEKIDKEKLATDPLLFQAYQEAKSVVKSSVWLQVEPDIIRKKYYSTKYQHFDDRSEGSI